MPMRQRTQGAPGGRHDGQTAKVTSHVSCRSAILWRGYSRVVADGSGLGHSVWNHVGRRLQSFSNRSPELAVLFYATDDDRAGKEVERLIRTAGFVPVKVGGIEQSSRLEVGGSLHDLVVGPAQARSSIGGA